MSQFAERAALAALLVGVVAPRALLAQDAQQMTVQPEIRVEVMYSERQSSLHAGAGAQIPLGYYVRIGVIGAIGAPIGGDGGNASARIDLLGRFLFDPFRQSRFGLSAGGGVSIRAERGERARPLLLAAVDIEGRRTSAGIVPALQLGLGGGVRIGVALRWGAPRTR